MLGLLLALVASAAERAPLPALPVERAVTLPRGWSSVDLAGSRLRSTEGSPELVRHALLLTARTAPLDRVELRAAVSAVAQAGVAGPGNPALGAAFRLLRTEAPWRSLALDLAYVAPLGAAPEGVPLGRAAPRLDLGLVGHARTGPLRASLRVAGVIRFPTATRDAADGLLAEPALLLQIGPLFPWVDLALASHDRAVDGRAGLGLQLTRGVALRGWLGRALAGPAPLHPAEPRGRSAAIALEIAA